MPEFAEESSGGGRSVGRLHAVVMLLEAATFAVAASLHLDARIPLGIVTFYGEPQSKAAVPELIIAAVLLLGAVVVLLRPDEARQVASIATGFAIFGVLVGLVTIAIGVGPRTVPDLIYHVGVMVVLLISFGVLMNRRRRRRSRSRPPTVPLGR
jgi:peptidoglycan/LPS O-acetylase OafA/YrhL